MLTKKISVLLSFLLMAVLVAGCGPAQAEQQAAAVVEDIEETTNEPREEAADEHHADESGDHDAEMDEHHEEEGGHEHAETPNEFEDIRNPFANDTAAIAAGQAIFETSCATCHGPAGEGDGPASKTLDPKPASLADTAMMQALSDGYLYWRISEGGQMEPFNSAMPAWKDGLSEQEIWQTISFVRSLSDSDMDDSVAEEEHHEAEDEEHHEDAAEEEHHEDIAAEEHLEDAAEEEHHEDGDEEEHHEDAAEDEEHQEDAAEEEHHEDGDDEHHE